MEAHNLSIALNARVDDGRALGGWRNTIRFNPLEPYGNYRCVHAHACSVVQAGALEENGRSSS